VKTIRKGDKGAEVTLCQERLAANGFYSDTVDGDFGFSTDQSVRRYQSANGLTVDGIVGRGTWGKLLADSSAQIEAIPVSGPRPSVIQHAESLGHTVWDEPWRLWLFGIRSPNRMANSFDDTLGCVYVDGNNLWRVHRWPGTTDPGTYWLENPMNSAGCAILVAKQYLDTWKIDLHGGKYEALCQRTGEVSVYRDSSNDNKLDLDPSSIATGYFGINIHAATQNTGASSTQVNKWSAGCQVHASEAGFAEMMKLARQQAQKIGRDTFSYTLMDRW